MSRAAPWILFIVAGLVGRALLDGPPPPRELAFGAGTPVTCATEVALEHTFYTNGFVQWPLCGGTLTFVATGSTVRGRGAHLHVAAGVDVVWDGEIRDPTTVVVTIDDPTWVTIAFLNDASDGAEDRNLWITGITYDGS